MSRVGVQPRGHFLQRVGVNPALEASQGKAVPAAGLDKGPPGSVAQGPALNDLGLEGLNEGLPEHELRSLERARDDLLKQLTRLVGRGGDRARLSEDARHFPTLLAELPASLRVPAALTVSGLVSGQVSLHMRGKLTDTSGLVESSVGLVRSLLQETDGLSGLQSLLSVLPVALEAATTDAQLRDISDWVDLSQRVAAGLAKAHVGGDLTLASVGEAIDQLRADLEGAEDRNAALGRWKGRMTRAAKGPAAEAPTLPAVAGRAPHHTKAAHSLLKALAQIPCRSDEEQAQLQTIAGRLTPMVPANQVTVLAELLNKLSTLVERAATEPAGPALRALLAHPTFDFTRASSQPEVRDALAKALSDPEETPRALVEASAVIRGQRVAADATLTEALEQLAEIGPKLALRVAAGLGCFGLSRNLEAAHVYVALDAAAGGRGSNLETRVQAALMRAGQLGDQLGRYPQLKPSRAPLLRALISSGLDPKAHPDGVTNALQALQHIKSYLPETDVAAVTSSAGDALIRVGDPNVRWAMAPVSKLQNLLTAVRPFAPNDTRQQNAIARAALRLSCEMAQIHGGEPLHNAQIQKDFVASVTKPRSLKSAFAPGSLVSVRLGSGHSVSSFLESHAQLPIDLAFTAGQHLMPEALAWLCERAEKIRGQASLRNLRDFVFGCVAANRLDLLEALRVSELPSRAVTRVVDAVANAYRGGQADAVPYDALIAGIREGRDVVHDLGAEKARVALAELNLGDLVEGEVAVSGAAAIAEQAENLAELLDQLQPGFTSTLDAEIDYGALRPIFMAQLKAIAEGRWPAARYDSEIGQELLAGCTPAQRDAWRENSVTAAAAAVPKAGEASPEVADAAVLVRGLASWISKQAKFQNADVVGKKLDAEGVIRLADALDTTVAELRDLNKDDRAQRRTLGQRAQSLGRDLALARFAVGVAASVAAGDEPARLLVIHRDALRELSGHLRKAGLNQAWMAATDALAVADTVERPTAKSGHYATDEDGLGSMIGSHTTGCLSKGDKRRRWGVVGALADANIKMLRVYRDGKQVYRTFFKLLDIELPGYKGPAVFVDPPRPDGGGNAQDLALLWKHLVAKGKLLGVPVMAKEDFSAAAQEIGWTCQNTNVQVFMHEGHTGYMHSDFLFNSGKGAIRDSRGAEPRWTFSKPMMVAKPPVGDNQ